MFEQCHIYLKHLDYYIREYENYIFALCAQAGSKSEVFAIPFYYKKPGHFFSLHYESVLHHYLVKNPLHHMIFTCAKKPLNMYNIHTAYVLTQPMFSHISGKVYVWFSLE